MKKKCLLKYTRVEIEENVIQNQFLGKVEFMSGTRCKL